VDGLRILRAKLRRHFGEIPENIRHWTKDNWCAELVTIIDDVYNDFTSDLVRSDAFRIYDDVTGIKHLVDNGWWIVNHSSAHYPVNQSRGWESVVLDFEECAGSESY
jgi:hypothetical protein